MVEGKVAPSADRFDEALPVAISPIRATAHQAGTHRACQRNRFPNGFARLDRGEMQADLGEEAIVVPGLPELMSDEAGRAQRSKMAVGDSRTPEFGLQRRFREPLLAADRDLPCVDQALDPVRQESVDEFVQGPSKIADREEFSPQNSKAPFRSSLAMTSVGTW